MITRWNADGTLDSDYGDGGVVELDGLDPRALLLLPSGDLLMAGRIEAMTEVPTGRGKRTTKIRSDGVLLVKLDSSGELVSDFGTDGVVIDDVTTGDDTAMGIAVLGSGRIVVAGERRAEGGFLRAYDSGGAVDTAFGDSGSVLSDEFLDAIDVDGNDKIVAAGFRTGSDNDGVVLRFDADGTADLDFGTNGTFSSGIAGGRTGFLDLVLTSAGDIVVAGWESATGSGAGDARLLRLDDTGALDSSFGTGGKSEALSPDAQFVTLTEDASGDLVGGGFVTTGGVSRARLARYCAE